jgi:hypothetical protein
MKDIQRKATWRFLGTLVVITICMGCANAQDSPPEPSNSQKTPQNISDVLQTIDQLVKQNAQLVKQYGQVERQNRELMDQIESLRRTLGAQTGAATLVPEHEEPEDNENPALTAPALDASQEGEPELTGAISTPQKEHKKFGTYTPNFGFTVADTDNGSLNVSIFSYVRYLNQLDLAPTYTNAFGVGSKVKQRQDFQLQKVQIKFLGWLFNPDFRYFLYVWTSNASMGQGAQVVVGGNLNYSFNKHFILSGGINGLPGTRTVEGNFPFWLSMDSRLIADEFFRPSYTSGIWARGLITEKLRYQAMLGDNLSQIGVNAGQLTNHLGTVSSALVWMPTTGEFGAGFGDFEQHDKLATRLGIHFTRSRENRQSQPGTEDFQNTQIRLSDGSIIFTPNLFGPGTTITDVTYKMTSFDGGIKLHGYSLEGEYYLRWLDDFRGSGRAGNLPGVFDQGFQIQTSAMVVPKTFQIYGGGSTIFGQYGTPYDARIGTNVFPWKNRVLRWNTEALYLYKSPVGNLSLPYVVGAKGWVFHTNVEMAF